MSDPHLSTGTKDEALNRRLSDELDAFNRAAHPGLGLPVELTVRADHDGDLVGGVSGWTWGEAAGISLAWVHEGRRGSGLGARLMSAFEVEARRRGCTHAFVTSFTFQAPGFYQRLGYEEILRWDAVPVPGSDDVHLRKQL